MVDFVREVVLLLLGQEAKPGPADDLADHIQVAAHTAVHVIHDDPFLGHVVLDDDEAVGLKAEPAPLQEVGEIVVRQVSWLGEKQRQKQSGPGVQLPIPPQPVMGLWESTAKLPP